MSVVEDLLVRGQFRVLYGRLGVARLSQLGSIGPSHAMDSPALGPFLSGLLM